MKNRIILFFCAFFQVALVACNVIFISTGNVLGMIVIGFLTSMIWSFNIKKMAFGSIWDRVSYALGAGLGTFFGYLISTYF
jgi:hypothetical protein